MAKAIINLQKESGGIVKISPVDGIGITEVTVPESGELVTKEYVDNSNVPFVANDNRVKTALNATGNAPIYACRAWANFSSTGVLTIKASANISSITDLGIGKFKPNFIESMPDINYDVSASTSYGTTNTASSVVQMFSNATTNYVAPTVSSFNFITFHPINSVVQDSEYISFSVRR